MNKKDFKVITINGFAGLFLFVCLISFTISSLIIMPIWGLKELWNYVIASYFGGPSIGFLNAVLLYLIIVLSCYAILRNFIAISFHKDDSIDPPEELTNLLDKMSENQDITEEDIKEIENQFDPKK